MRDPGRPRRNPFFEHGSDAEAGDAGMGWRDSEPSDPVADDAVDPDPVGAATAGGFATVLALVEALGDAQPDATEHLVAAAHEVVLAVKVLVDATEAALAEQRVAMASRRADGRSSDEPEDASIDLSVVRPVDVP